MEGVIKTLEGLFVVLFLAALTDWKTGKIYNRIILLGIGLGCLELLAGKAGVWELICFWGRMIGTCALFYGFFLWRKLGAGDIKLMAVCVGILGVWNGVLVLFAGMMLALFSACIKGGIYKHGYLHMKNQELKLAPYLFAGYCFSVFFGVI